MGPRRRWLPMSPVLWDFCCLFCLTKKLPLQGREEGSVYLLLWPSLIFISLEADCRNKEIKGTRLQLARGLRSFLKQFQGQSQSLRYSELAALCGCQRVPWWRNIDSPSYWQSNTWDKLAQYYNLELKVSPALAQVTAPKLWTAQRLRLIH